MAHSEVSCQKCGCDCLEYETSTKGKGRCKKCHHPRLEHARKVIDDTTNSNKYVTNKRQKKKQRKHKHEKMHKPNGSIIDFKNIKLHRLHETKENDQKPQQLPITNNQIARRGRRGAIAMSDQQRSLSTVTNARKGKSMKKKSKKKERNSNSFTLNTLISSIRPQNKKSSSMNHGNYNQLFIEKRMLEDKNNSNLKKLTELNIALKNEKKRYKTDMSVYKTNKMVVKLKNDTNNDGNDDILFEEHDQLIKQRAFQQVDNLNKEIKKWRTKYFEQGKQLKQLRQEKLESDKQQKELNEKIERLQDELDCITNNDELFMVTTPSTISNGDEEYNDSDEKNEDDMSNYKLSDDQLCQLLQEDLENYIEDQKKNQKTQWRKEQNNGDQKNRKKKQQRVILKQLRLFPENKSQIKRNWTSLKKNDFQRLFEKYEEILEQKYEDDVDVDSEKLAYHILFDTVIGCYKVLYTEFNKLQQNIYDNPNVINMVLMNLCYFYELMQLPIDNSMSKKLRKRIANIYTYIDDEIEEIYKNAKKKHLDDMNDDFIVKDELCKFIVDCCEIIWSVLYYNYTMIPSKFLLNKKESIYDDKIHEREGGYSGDSIEYCVFPAIIKQTKMKQSEYAEYETKIWVICDGME